MIGGTKKAELDRSAILFEKIAREQGLYFALIFLLDSEYGRVEILAIAERLKPKPVKEATQTWCDNNDSCQCIYCFNQSGAM